MNIELTQTQSKLITITKKEGFCYNDFHYLKMKNVLISNFQENKQNKIKFSVFK